MTEDAVFASANRIYAATGRDPTYDELIEAVGGGSNSTLKPFLETWQRNRPTLHTVPSALANTAIGFVTDLWGQAMREAQKAFEAYKTAADDDVATVARQRDIAIGEIERFETELDSERRKTESLRVQCAELQVRVQQADQLGQRVRELEQQLQQVRDQREAAKLDAGQARGQVTALERQLKRAVVWKAKSATPPRRSAAAKTGENGHAQGRRRKA